MKAEVDDVICAITPEPFQAVGRWYQDFSQTTDEEVHELLAPHDRLPERAAGQSAADAQLIEALRTTVHPLTGATRDFRLPDGPDRRRTFRAARRGIARDQ